MSVVCLLAGVRGRGLVLVAGDGGAAMCFGCAGEVKGGGKGSVEEVLEGFVGEDEHAEGRKGDVEGF